MPEGRPRSRRAPGRDRRVLGLIDEPVERGLAKVVVAPGERAHGPDEVSDPRDRSRLAADPQLRAPGDDLHVELALDAVDVRLVRAGDEHHLVGVRDEDRDLRSGTHDACSRSSALTTPDTIFPSARPFVSAITLGMTTLVSCGPFAPLSRITRAAISRTFASSSCSGR